MAKIRLALIAGGKSDEREVSLRGAAGVEQALDPEKYEVTRYDPATVTLTTFPLQLSSNSRHFLKPKYRQIRSIAFEGIGNIFDGNGDGFRFPGVEVKKN